MTTIDKYDRIQTRKVLIEIAERRYWSAASPTMDFFIIVPSERFREVLTTGVKANKKGFIEIFHDGTFYHNGSRIAISEYIAATRMMSDFSLFRIKNKAVQGNLLPSHVNRLTRTAEYTLVQNSIEPEYLRPCHRASAKYRGCRE